MRSYILVASIGSIGILTSIACDPTTSGGGSDPDDCEPVTCEMACEYGFAKNADGCEICACADAPCDGPNPAGCSQTGCDAGEVCDTTVGCEPSSCSCDPASGGWACTDDCGGGTCVPDGSASCDAPNPAGCVQTGCPSGQVCDTTVGCFPSSCSCDDASSGWICTEDCGGGQCVPEGGGCDASNNPAGCVQTGCASGETCDTTLGCHPSACTCDPNGGWACTDDCSGGECVPLDVCDPANNPAGCVQTGCGAGETCDTMVGCYPSSCFCTPEGWGCTDDCGGGACVPE